MMPGTSRAPSATSRRRQLRRLFPSRNRGVRSVLSTVEKVLETDTSLLILGESGTGKNHLAELIHRFGSRRGEFVSIECAGLPDELFEAELFGYEKGAFTDAKTRKPGKVELAHRGTLYLDEVGALGPSLQAKLLRFVQEKSFSRLGGHRTVNVDVRLISSSNLPLDRMIEEERFRRDLFYRLNVVPLVLPPLRERPEDIAPLAELFLKQAEQRLGRRFRGFEAAALELLTRHSWPGNVRELQNVILRAAVLEASEWISAGSLPVEGFVEPEGMLSQGADEQWSLEMMEQHYIREVLRRTGSNFSRAAAILGINRKTLLEKRRKYGIN